MIRKSNPEEKKGLLQRQIVYSFGDHYDLRKELKILNLLTGYQNFHFRMLFFGLMKLLISEVNNFAVDIRQVYFLARQIW